MKKANIIEVSITTNVDPEFFQVNLDDNYIKSNQIAVSNLKENINFEKQ